MNELLSYIKNITAKKKFGQNFLICPSILDKIIAAAHINKETSIIEIGPGPGSLTRWILRTSVKSIYTIERDPSMKEYLDSLASPKLHIQFIDALKINFWELGESPRSVVANLPYNVATPLLIKMLSNASCFKHLVLMFQKEVADRILAKPYSKAYGRLSIISQLFSKVSRVTDVPPSAFKPQPKITSSVLQFTPYEKPLYPVHWPTLQRLLHHIFQQRRKMLRSNLKGFIDNPLDVLSIANIDPTRRPETLSLEMFCSLSNAIKNYYQ